jgi:hypothetical protein
MPTHEHGPDYGAGASKPTQHFETNQSLQYIVHSLLLATVAVALAFLVLPDTWSCCMP